MSALTGDAGYRQPPSYQGGTLPHRGETSTRGDGVPGLAGHEAGAVILDPGQQLVRDQRDSDQYQLRRAVRQGIADRLTNDQERFVDDGKWYPRLVSAASQPHFGIGVCAESM